MGYLGLVEFTVIWGSFGARQVFAKYDFQNAASYTTKIFVGVSYDSPRKSSFLAHLSISSTFEIKEKKKNKI